MENQKFSNGELELPVRVKGNEIEFDAEQAAIGLGISEVAKSGNTVVKWTRINKYLGIDTSVDRVKRGDFITEQQFYKLAIKANNQVAEKFQDWVTGEVLPSIRKNGAYLTNQKAYDITHDKGALADLLLQAGNQLKEAQAKIKEMQPKVDYYEIIL